MLLVARAGVSPALDGHDLLQHQLELLVRVLGDLAVSGLLPDPPKHPELYLVQVSKIRSGG